MFQSFRLYYAQSLFQAGMFDEAFRVTTDIEALDTKNKNLRERVLQLQSAIRYSNEDYSGAQSILLQRKASHESTLNDEGCLLYQVGIINNNIEIFYVILFIAVLLGQCL